MRSASATVLLQAKAYLKVHFGLNGLMRPTAAGVNSPTAFWEESARIGEVRNADCGIPAY